MRKSDLKLRILQLYEELHKNSEPGILYIVEYSGKRYAEKKNSISGNLKETAYDFKKDVFIAK